MFALSALLVGSLSACDNPAASDNANADGTDNSGTSTSAGVSSITKAQYIALLECYGSKSPESKAIIDQVKVNVNLIPDATWAAATAGAGGAAFQAQMDAALKAGCGV